MTHLSLVVCGQRHRHRITQPGKGQHCVRARACVYVCVHTRMCVAWAGCLCVGGGGGREAVCGVSVTCPGGVAWVVCAALCVGGWGGGRAGVWCGWVVYRCHRGPCGRHGCARVACACGCWRGGTRKNAHLVVAHLVGGGKVLLKIFTSIYYIPTSGQALC